MVLDRLKTLWYNQAMNSTELAWAAGFFDGDGCTSTYYSTDRVFLRCSVGQVELQPLERFIAAVGCGKIYGPYSGTNFHRLIFNSKNAWKVLDLLWPYLSEPKRNQAILKGYNPAIDK